MVREYFVKEIDNRAVHMGFDAEPFGFIYLVDAQGRQMGRMGFGAHRENKLVLAVWPTRLTPKDLSEANMQRIQHVIDLKFPDYAGKMAQGV